MTTTSILLISGSLRDASINSAAIRTAHRLIEAPVESRIYDELGDLPHFDPDVEARELPPTADRLRRSIDACDAILICTPEYAGSLPGSFKNLLDWTVGGVEIVDKPTAWINASSSATQARGAHAALRTVLGYTGAKIIENACRHIPIGRADVSDEGVVQTTDVLDQVKDVLAVLLTSVTADAG